MSSHTTPPITSIRNRHNVLVRHHGADDPRTRQAAAGLRAAKMAELIESAPPLSAEQVERLRGLLPAADVQAGEAA